MKRKKILALLILAVMSLLMVSSLFGCKLADEDRKFYTDYFFCIYNEDYTEVTILELTDLGKEQEILVIPKTINGVPVNILGGYTIQWGGPNTGHNLASNYTKKIYVDFNIHISDRSLNMPHLQDIIVSPFDFDSSIRILSNKAQGETSVNVFIRQGIIGTDYFIKNGIHESYDKFFKEANISFYIDDSGMPYFVDSYSPSDLYLLPQIPIKDGFVFEDWYLEAECINKWNGEYPQSQEEKLNLYAKWIKN